MEISEHRHNGITAFSLVGKLEFTSSSRLKEKVQAALSEGRVKIILDLTQVDFVNSSGLGTLISILKQVRQSGGRLMLSGLAPVVKEIFEITQLEQVFEIYPSEAAARAQLLSESSERI